jgi:hypothetical protein
MFSHDGWSCGKIWERNAKAALQGETAMDDLLARLQAGPSGNVQQDRETMQRAAHEIKRLQVQLEEARSPRGAPHAHEVWHLH